MAINPRERARIFGPPGRGDYVTIVTPWGMKVVAHRLIAALFLEACREAYEEVPWWRPKRIDSYANRPIRGSSSPSMHAYALAWDFFITGPNVPPPGGVWTPDNPVPPEFAECFTRRGFRWGAQFSRVDLPHIEWPNGLPDYTATPARPAPPSGQEDDLPYSAEELKAIVKAAAVEAVAEVLKTEGISGVDAPVPYNVRKIAKKVGLTDSDLRR